MDRRFSEEPEEGVEENPSRSRMFLLVLLLVVAVLGYLYFFTDLVMPRKAAEQSKPLVQQIKQPMPKKPETMASTAGPAGQKPVSDVAKSAETPAQPAKTVPVTARKEPQKAVVAQTKPSAPKTEPPNVAKAEKIVAKPTPAKVAEAKPDRNAATNKEQKHLEKTVTKEPSTVATKAPSAQKNAKVGACMILVGEYVLDSQLTRDREKVGKAGLEAIVTQAGKKPEPMHRLFMADYADHAGAVAAISKLNAAGGQGFLLEENGKYAVYAGSYFLASKAASEQKKLATKGIKLVIRKAMVPLAVSRLSAGRYASGAEAVPALQKLAKQGLKGKLVPLDAK